MVALVVVLPIQVQEELEQQTKGMTVELQQLKPLTTTALVVVVDLVL
jgi:hypothetical protein